MRVAIDAVAAGPVVEVARGAARTLVRVGVDHLRGAERLARMERIFRTGRVGPGQYGQAVGFVHLEVQPEVAAPGQGSGDDFAALLAEGVAVERQQESGLFGVGGPHAARRLDTLRPVVQQRVFDLRLAGPGAVEVGQQVLPGPEREPRGVEVAEFDHTFLPVADQGVCRDDVLPGVGREDEFDVERLTTVAEADSRLRDIPVGKLLRGVRNVTQFGIRIAVGVRDAQGRVPEVETFGRGVGRNSGAESRQRCRVVDPCPEVALCKHAARCGREDQREPVGMDVDRPGGLLGRDRRDRLGRRDRCGCCDRCDRCGCGGCRCSQSVRQPQQGQQRQDHSLLAVHESEYFPFGPHVAEAFPRHAARRSG